MDDLNQIGAAHWTDRSRAWTATAATGLSTDDSFNRMIVEHAGIGPGERILDIGSGTGDPAITIGVALDGEGSVTACDLTPAMLETARKRADTVGIANMHFVAADMAALPYPADSFDAVTCRFGLMFPSDRIAAAKEALRVLRPGGRVAYVVWGPYEENPPFFVLKRAVLAVSGGTEGPPPQRHSLGRPGQLSGILAAAGFADIEERELRYRRPVEDLDDYIDRGLRRGYPDMIADMDSAARLALLARLREAFEPWRDGGIVYMPNCARLGMGRKAG
ncbi:MAG: class I SAM-dependent methyltransferase [Rhodospirillaceae bacterium]